MSLGLILDLSAAFCFSVAFTAATMLLIFGAGRLIKAMCRPPMVTWSSDVHSTRI